VVVGSINGVVALTGFSYEEMYGRFTGKESGRNNEVVVGQGSTVTAMAQFRCIKIELKTTSLNTSLWGINCTNVPSLLACA